MKAFRALVLCIITSASLYAAGAKPSLKTNLLGDALLSPNVGVEVAVAPKLTVDVPLSFNGWTLSHERRWKHATIQPGIRYWFCNPYAGHFVGAHVHGGIYNIGGIHNNISFLGTDFSKLTDSRFQGWFLGAGVSYGYSWILNRHWNIEAEIGFGWSYTRYDRYPCQHCGKKIESDKAHNYVGPTKAAVNLVYAF